MKKALCNMGGVMCFKHGARFDIKYPRIGHMFKKTQIISYGNDSYGALSGRDIAAATIGFYEVVKQDYLDRRIGQIEYFGVSLAKKGIPVILPPGGHAVYLDVNRIFPMADWKLFKGVGFVIELLRKYGIRGCELGYMCWELDRYVDENGKLPERMPPNLIRFAVPANMYHLEHIEYCVESISQLYQDKDSVPGMEITRGKEIDLRHFVVGMRPIGVGTPVKMEKKSEKKKKKVEN